MPPAKAKSRLGAIVKVTWFDAWFDYDHGKAVFRDNFPVQTVGFLVRDDSGIVSVAAEILPDNEGLRGVTHIPRAIVDKVEFLVKEEA